MILSNSSSSYIGTSAVRTIANFASNIYQYMVYSDTTLSRAITGTGIGLTKNGSGVLTLSAVNSYTGNTTISGGILSIIDVTALPGYNTNGRFAVAPNATLAVYNAVTDAQITTLRNTTNFRANANLGFDTTTGNRTYPVLISNTSNGALGVVKLGTNTLTLTAANTYTGQTNVLAGTLSTGVANVIPDTSPVYIASGANLNLGGSDTIATLSGAGTLNTTSQLIFNSSNNATFTGIISSNYYTPAGGNIIYKQGTGTQTFSGATVLFGDPNSSTSSCGLRQDSGGISILGGSFIQTLSAAGVPRNYQICINGGTGTLTVAQSALFTNKGLMLGDNSVVCNCTVNVSSGGSFINSGETWFSGTTGTMNIDNGYYSTPYIELGGGTNGVAAVNNLNISNRGAFVLTNQSYMIRMGRSSTSVNTININSGGTLSATYIEVLSGVNATSNIVNFDGGIYSAIQSASNTTYSYTFVTYRIKSGGATLNVPSGLTHTFNPNLIQDATSTGGGLSKTGAGQLNFGGTGSTYTGQLSVLEGTFSVSTLNNNSANGVFGNSTLPIVLGSSGKSATLQYTGSTTTNNKTISLASNSIGTIDVSNALTLTGVISGSGTLVKAGAGTLELQGNNTFSGGATLNAGILSIGSNAALGTGTIIFNGGQIRSYTTASTTLTNTVSISTDTTFPTIASEKSLTFAGSTTLFGATRTLTVNTGATVATESINFTGAIGDGGNGYGITKTGTGTLVLSGQNTYSGNTSLSSGNTRFKYAPVGEIRFGATAYVQFDAGITTDVSSRILNNSNSVRVDTNGQNGTFASLLSSNSGGLVKTGTGTLTLSTTPIGTDPNGIRGTITSNGGELSFTGTLSTASVIYASNGAGTSGTISISGAVIQTAGTTPRQFQIAPTAGVTGTLNVYSGGTIRNTATGGIMLGENNGGTGIMNIYGGTVDVGGGSFYFAGPTATLSMSAGTLNTGGMYLAGGTGATSSFTINGGTATPSVLFFGQGAGIGTLNLNGGLISTGYLSFVSLSAHVVNFNGGTLRTTLNGATIGATVITNIGTGGCFYDQPSNTGSIYSVLSSQGTDGGLTKLGAGTLQLSAVNVYTGTTSISAGTLRVLKKISGTGTDASFSQANFTSSTLSVIFNSVPNVGDTYKLFPATTTNSYASVTLVGATGRTGSYNSSNSTLTIA